MIDLDGCVYDFHAAFASCIREQRGTPQAVFTPPVVWDFHDDPSWGMDGPDEFYEAMRRAIRKQNLFSRGGPYQGSADALHKLSAMGHDLYAVSARKYGLDTEAQAFKQTTWWCEWMKLPFKEILLIGGSDMKSDVCLEHGLTHAIDDAAHHYWDLEDNGIEVVLLDRPWNETEEHASRVFGWDDFVKAMSR